MVHIEHTPIRSCNGVYDKHWTISGDNIEEIVEAALLRVRSQSKGYYGPEIRSRLERTGYAFIDVHAGQGRQYDVKLK